MAVVEFRIAWNTGSMLVLNPGWILTCGTRMIRATATGIGDRHNNNRNGQVFFP